MIDDYFQSLLALIAESPVVRSSNLDFDRRGKFEGVIRGNLYFADDTPHYPDLSSFPHHKHTGNKTEVIAAEPPGLKSVLAEIARIVAAE